ncbi:uncharacterized protein JCM15063_001673 [Sporobolomyces koalae]|uniref:uncharacterized protein n=1 Tax=Sporobolomyces koalae TaxID=500713 RepID=UPI00318104DD
MSVPALTQPEQVYRPYTSTLSRYPLLGGRPSTSLSIPLRPDEQAGSVAQIDGSLDSSTPFLPTTPRPANSGSASDVGSAGLSTFVAQRHQIDPARKWCKAESLGGVCKDGTCKNVHERDWVAKGA